jgi:outer membrane lipopolysaccharide assembly protein LptE/RlpB
VTWSLTHQDQIIIEKAKYTEMGDYSFDRNLILGKVNESNFIKESLAEQVVEKIILRMSEVT